MFTFFVAGYMNRIETTDLFWEIENLHAAAAEVDALLTGIKCPDDMAPTVGADMADVANGTPLAEVLDRYADESHALVTELVHALGIEA